MKKLKYSLIAFLFTMTAVVGSSQIPDNVDPGNARGDEGTIQLWENPSIYIPFLIVVAVIIGVVIYRSKKG
jgi:hypothetical protein